MAATLVGYVLRWLAGNSVVQGYRMPAKVWMVLRLCRARIQEKRPALDGRALKDATSQAALQLEGLEGFCMKY